MDGLSGAASAIAVIQITASVVSEGLNYYQSVKNAKADIDRLQSQIDCILILTNDTKIQLDGPNGYRFKTSEKLCKPLQECCTQLKTLQIRLGNKPKAGRSSNMMRRLGMKRLKWPFEKNEIETIIGILEQKRELISSAVALDTAAEVSQLANRFDIAALPVANDAIGSSFASQHEPRCLPGTRVEVLDQIQAWMQDCGGKCIYWLYGMAGTGKSTISRTVAERICSKDIPRASFFFKKGEGDRGRANMLFATISKQLIDQLPAQFCQHLRTALDSNPNLVERSLKEQFEKLLLEPLNSCNVGQLPKVIAIIIDALDECDREMHMIEIISLLSRAREVTNARLKLFITSRPELPIRPTFKDLGKERYHDLVLHEIPAPQVRNDISIFIKFELEKTRDMFNKSVPTTIMIPKDWPSPADVECLVDIAVPLFIFASTVCAFIGDNVADNPKRKLETFLGYQTEGYLSQLHKLYLPVLTQRLLLKKAGSDYVERDEHEKIGILERFRQIVGAIILLAENLSTTAFGQLVGIKTEDIELYLNSLHSVLDIPSDRVQPVRLLHLSFRDFLIDPNLLAGNIFWVDERKTHANLADSCLNLLSTGGNLRRDICDLKLPGSKRSNTAPALIAERLPRAVQYACRYWVYHAKHSNRRVQDGDNVHRFLKTHFLHWLEALALLGRVHESVGMVQELLESTNATQDSQVAVLLQDAKRFIQYSRAGVEASLLQVYHSALVFAPEKSTIRQMFHNEFPKWVISPPKVNLAWDSCLETLEGHTGWVNGVAWGPDGKLASASGDRTVRVWDVKTGICTVTLEGHTGWVRGVAWRPDGKLASASDDRTVRVWDVKTGICTVTLKGHTEGVNGVAWGPDGQLASASDDRTVRVWDVKTGKSSIMLRHDDPIKEVFFDKTGITLHTNVGTYAYPPAKTESVSDVQFMSERIGNQPSSAGWRLTKDNTWICFNTHDALWLPPDYRPSASAFSGSKLAIGYASGRVISMVFDTSPSPFE